MEGGPMTRSRRNLITESSEKENINSAPGTPVKIASSIDTSPARMASISSPARITRNRRSLSFCNNPPDSPSKNLRKKNGSPQSVKSSPMKINTPKKLENASIAEMTPTKRLLKRNDSILATVDSPKPRRTRYSLSDASDSNLDTSVRRSRRLSTDLSVVTEDPISEAIVELPAIVPKTRRGKRMSVAPSQPALPEENESSDANSEKIESDIRQITELGKVEEALDNCSGKISEKSPSPSTKRASLNISAKEPYVALQDISDVRNSPKNRSIVAAGDTNGNSEVVSDVQSIKSRDNSYEESPNDTFLNFKLDNSSDDLNSSNKSIRKKRLSAKDVFIQEKSPISENTKEKSFSSNTPNAKSNRSSMETNVSGSPVADILNTSKSNSFVSKKSPKVNNTNGDDEEDFINFDTTLPKARESLTGSKNDSSHSENDIADGNTTIVSKLNTSRNGDISNSDDKMDVDVIQNTPKNRLSKSGSNKSLNISSSSIKSNREIAEIADADVSSRSMTRRSNGKYQDLYVEKTVDVDDDGIPVTQSPKIRLSSTGDNTLLNVSNRSSKSNKSYKNEDDIDVDVADTTATPNTKKRKSSINNQSSNINNISIKSNREIDEITDADVSSKSMTRRSNGKYQDLYVDEIIEVDDDDITVIPTPKKRLSSTGEITSLNVSNKSSKSNKSYKNEDDIDDDVANTTATPKSKKRQSSIDNQSLNISVKSNKSLINEDVDGDVANTTATPKSKKRQSSIDNDKSLNISNSSSKSKSNRSLKITEILDDSTEISKSKRLSSGDENKSLNVSKSSNKSLKKRSSISASTPMIVNKSGNKSNDKKEMSRSSNNRSSLGKSFLDSESEDDSSDGNSLLEKSAFDAGVDYRSGDSMDESERLEIEMNEYHEIGETLVSSDSEDEESDDTYEKDSFICSSENEEPLLSGTGDDLSSGEELTQSAKSKAKYNKKQEEEQKRASREMFLARHSGEKSPAKPKNKLRIESDDSDSSVDDEAEITNVSMKSPATKDPLSISEIIPQKEDSEEDEDATLSSDDEDIRNTFNEELKKLQSIEVDSDSSDDEKSVELNGDKTIRDEDLISSKEIKKKSRSVLNKSDSGLKSKYKKSKKMNKSLSLSECEKNYCGDVALSSLTVQGSIEWIRKMDESVSKVYTSLMNKMDHVTCSLDANIQNSLKNQPEPAIEEISTIPKRKIESFDDAVEIPQKKICISTEVQSEKKEPSSSSAIEKTDNKPKQAENCLKISNKSKAIKRRKTSLSDTKTDKISDAAKKLISIPADLIEQKKGNKVTATSDFKVESKNAKSNKITWTDTAGEFSVMPVGSGKNIYNSTTNFKVIPLRKHPKSAIQVDKAIVSNFIDFKTSMLYGKNIKRVASTDLRSRRDKMKARK